MIPFTARQAGTLIESLKGKRPHFIGVSSIDVYRAYGILHNAIPGPLQELPLTESSDTRDLICFPGVGYDKLNVERIYWSYFTNCALVRLPAVYGLPDRLRIECYSEPILNNTEIKIHPLYASWRFSRSANVNCGHAIALCVKSDGKEIFNVSEKHSYSEEEWCRKIGSTLGKEPIISISDDHVIPYSMNVNQEWFVDSSKIRSLLGYDEVVDPDDFLRETLAKMHPANKAIQADAFGAADL